MGMFIAFRIVLFIAGFVSCLALFWFSLSSPGVRIEIMLVLVIICMIQNAAQATDISTWAKYKSD